MLLRESISQIRRNSALNALLFGVISLLPLLFFFTPGTDDVTIFWMPWIHNAERFGVVAGFAENHSDYGPLCNLLFGAVILIGRISGLSLFLALKSLIVAALFATSAVFYLWTRTATLTASLHLALTLSSAALAYLDIFVALPLLGALWALERGKLILFALLFSIAALLKWQPLIALPVLLVYVIRPDRDKTRQKGWAHIFREVILPGGAMFVLTAGVFGWFHCENRLGPS